MNAILRHSPVGVMLEDAAGRDRLREPGGRVDLQPPGVRDARAKAGRDLRGRRRGAERRTPRSDGTLELHMRDPDRIVHVRRVVIPGLEGEPAGVLTLHEDVTAQRLALEAKDLMLRAIGHEVRSPAAAMKNTLAGIMQWDDDDRRERPARAAAGGVRVVGPPAQPRREPADHRQARDAALRAESRARRPGSGARRRHGRPAPPLRGRASRGRGRACPTGLPPRLLRADPPRPGAHQPDRQRARVHDRAGEGRGAQRRRAAGSRSRSPTTGRACRRRASTGCSRRPGRPGATARRVAWASGSTCAGWWSSARSAAGSGSPRATANGTTFKFTVPPRIRAEH